MNAPVVTTVTVLGVAVPKGRPRAFRVGAGIRMHTPVATANYETQVRLSWAEHVRMDRRLAWPIQGPVELDVTFYRAPPGSLSKTRRAAALAGMVNPTTRPDLDNLVKAVKDALNGIAYRDDSQIVTLHATKRYGEQPRAIIRLTALEGA